MIISEFYGSNEYYTRRASVHIEKEALHIELYDNEQYVRTLEVENKTLRYAEDAAENWVIGVIN